MMMTDNVAGTLYPSVPLSSKYLYIYMIHIYIYAFRMNQIKIKLIHFTPLDSITYVVGSKRPLDEGISQEGSMKKLKLEIDHLGLFIIYIINNMYIINIVHIICIQKLIDAQ
jgi:hypothetical protein